MSRERFLAAATLVTGLAVIAVSLSFLWMDVQPIEPLHGDYAGNAIIAFEFAETPEQLAKVIGPDPPSSESVKLRALLDRANRVDFAYMAIYGVFIAFAFALCATARNHRWLLMGVLLGPVAALCDLAENLTLLQLTKTGVDTPALLASLHLRTMAKWELLAVASALFAAGFLGDPRRWVNAVAALVVLLALGGGALTMADSAKYSGALLNAIAVVWLWQLAYAGALLWFRRPP